MPYNGSGEVITKILEMLAVYVLISIVLFIVMYIFESIALYSLSKRRRLGTSAFGWIPVLSVFKTGQIADQAAYIGSRTVVHYKWLMPAFYVAGIICILIAEHISGGAFTLLYSPEEAAYNTGLIVLALAIYLIGLGLNITAYVFQCICLYYIYRSCTEHYVVLLVLGIIINILPPFFLFAVRKKVNYEYFNMN